MSFVTIFLGILTFCFIGLNIYSFVSYLAVRYQGVGGIFSFLKGNTFYEYTFYPEYFVTFHYRTRYLGWYTFLYWFTATPVVTYILYQGIYYCLVVSNYPTEGLQKGIYYLLYFFVLVCTTILTLIQWVNEDSEEGSGASVSDSGAVHLSSAYAVPLERYTTETE